jgi:SAM-dependent methyltransferase
MSGRLSLEYRSAIGRHGHCVWLASSVGAAEPDFPPTDAARVVRLPRADFNERLVRAAFGRFYPAKVLAQVHQWPQPFFRIRALDTDGLLADFNHPLAGRDARLELVAAEGPGTARGKPTDLLQWAGMEAPLDAPTDFADAEAFAREDDADDARFYQDARRVLHIDAVCAARIRCFYGEQLQPGSRVLDLMSSWRSHLPEGLGEVVGLGMNAAEMRDNPQLNRHAVHDLNRSPRLPFADASFDAVVNTVSFEYLIYPLDVLEDVRRVLKPGGKLLVTFSTRFFPPKAIRLWTHLHPMERLGWVLQGVQRAGFAHLESHVERGLARDPQDRYADQFPEMDPLFAAVGTAP